MDIIARRDFECDGSVDLRRHADGSGHFSVVIPRSEVARFTLELLLLDLGQTDRLAIVPNDGPTVQVEVDEASAPVLIELRDTHVRMRLTIDDLHRALSLFANFYARTSEASHIDIELDSVDGIRWILTIGAERD